MLTCFLAGMKAHLLLVVSRKNRLWAWNKSTNTTFTMRGGILTNINLTALVAFTSSFLLGADVYKKVDDLARNSVKFKKVDNCKNERIQMYQKNEERLYLIWIAKNNWKWSHVRIQSIEQLMSMKKKVNLQHRRHFLITI